MELPLVGDIDSVASLDGLDDADLNPDFPLQNPIPENGGSTPWNVRLASSHPRGELPSAIAAVFFRPLAGNEMKR